MKFLGFCFVLFLLCFNFLVTLCHNLSIKCCNTWLRSPENSLSPLFKKYLVIGKTLRMLVEFRWEEMGMPLKGRVEAVTLGLISLVSDFLLPS